MQQEFFYTASPLLLPQFHAHPDGRLWRAPTFSPTFPQRSETLLCLRATSTHHNSEVVLDAYMCRLMVHMCNNREDCLLRLVYRSSFKFSNNAHHSLLKLRSNHGNCIRWHHYSNSGWALIETEFSSTRWLGLRTVSRSSLAKSLTSPRKFSLRLLRRLKVSYEGLIILINTHHTFILDPAAELLVAKRKINELESLNKHVQSEVCNSIILVPEKNYWRSHNNIFVFLCSGRN